jgi:hypothetical protein
MPGFELGDRHAKMNILETERIYLAGWRLCDNRW